MSSTFCPDCDGEIAVDLHVSLGQRIACPHCHVDLEVIHLNPVWLDWTYVRSEEDWGEVQSAEWVDTQLSHGAWAAQDVW